MKCIILHLNDGSDGKFALSCAQQLAASTHKSCAYRKFDGTITVFVHRNKASITAWEQPHEAGK